MANNMDSKKNWPDRPAARRYTVWTVLWILIALALLTWIFAFTYGDQPISSIETRGTSSIAFVCEDTAVGDGRGL